MTPRYTLFGILFFITTVFANTAHPQSDLKSAERVAREYMTAFYRGDFDKAAKLTHPDTLATLKRSFLIQLEQAQREGRQNEFLNEIGVKEDVRTLRAMNPHDLYVTLVKSNQKRGSSDALKTMKKTKVEILSSEMRGADQAAVRLRIKIPADDGVEDRAGGLLLSRYKKYWRVKTNLE
jgi:predicted lipid-binding transport protein (Tim44 family)